MSEDNFNFLKILLNQLQCIKCNKKGDFQIIDVKSVTERNASLKINPRLLTKVKATPEDYYALQCYECAELHVIDKFKLENLIINKSKIGHWDENKVIKINEQGFITIE